jgi:hypothetical protein
MKTTKQIIEVMQAFVEGKKVQYLDANDKKTWHTIYGDPEWRWDVLDYRVKPEPTYRPWKAKEVPVGKVVKIKNPRPEEVVRAVIVSALASDVPGGVLIYVGMAYSGNSVFAQRLFDEWEMEDGTPCGVLE